MHKFTLIVSSSLVVGGLLGGCSENWKVKREDPATWTDTDYRFNDTDARETAEKVTADCLSRPWASNWSAAHGGKQPTVFLGNVKNNTQDYAVNPELFTNAMQREMINSGRIKVKAPPDARKELRDERLDTQYNDPETVKAVAKELNADFALTGNVQQVLQTSNDGKHKINSYQINMELTNVETAEKVWIGSHEIKKSVKRY